MLNCKIAQLNVTIEEKPKMIPITNVTGNADNFRIKNLQKSAFYTISLFVSTQYCVSLPLLVLCTLLT